MIEPNPPADPHASAKFVLDVIDGVLKLLAVIIGAAWTLMTYLRGRTFKRRLEPAVEATLGRKGHLSYASITCHLKNVGLSKCPIEQQGTACIVSAKLIDGSEEELDKYSVFEKHGWIEPGESVSQPLMATLSYTPGRVLAIRVRLRVVAEGIEWNASCDTLVK